MLFRSTDVTVRNRTGQLIELGWRVLSKKRWLLTVELSAGAGRAADQIVKGELVLGFPGQDLQPLPIPVHAIIVGLKR